MLFPDSDTDIAAYAAAVAAPMKTHSAALAARGFDVEQQHQLVAATAAFRQALGARPAESAKLDRDSATRKRVFAALRTYTKYVRKIGRAATRKTAARADFDRVGTVTEAVVVGRAVSRATRAASEAAKARAEAARAQAEADKLAAEAQAKAARLAAKKAKKKGKKAPPA